MLTMPQFAEPPRCLNGRQNPEFLTPLGDPRTVLRKRSTGSLPVKRTAGSVLLQQYIVTLCGAATPAVMDPLKHSPGFYVIYVYV